MCTGYRSYTASGRLPISEAPNSNSMGASSMPVASCTLHIESAKMLESALEQGRAAPQAAAEHASTQQMTADTGRQAAQAPGPQAAHKTQHSKPTCRAMSSAIKLEQDSSRPIDLSDSEPTSE